MNIHALDPLALQQRIGQMSMQQLMQQSSEVAKMLKRDPRNFRLHFTMALMMQRNGETLSVVNHLKKALKFKPDFELGYQVVCELLMKKLGKFAEALKYLKKWQAVHKGSDTGLIWACIGECYIELNNPDAAYKAFERAKRLSPELQRIYLAGTKIYSKAGDLELAMENAQKAFDMEPNEAATVALAGLPNFGNDRATVENVAEIANNAADQTASTYLHAQAATGFEKLGDYERAFHHMELSNKTGPGELNVDQTLAGFKNLRETFTNLIWKAAKGLATKASNRFSLSECRDLEQL